MLLRPRYKPGIGGGLQEEGLRGGAGGDHAGEERLHHCTPLRTCKSICRAPPEGNPVAVQGAESGLTGLSDDLRHWVGITARLVAPELDAPLFIDGPKRIGSQVSDGRHVGGVLATARSGLVLPEGESNPGPRAGAIQALSREAAGAPALRPGRRMAPTRAHSIRNFSIAPPTTARACRRTRSRPRALRGLPRRRPAPARWR